MGAADAMLARLQTEVEERQTFMDGLVEGAEKDGRDLTEQEMSLLARARERVADLGKQVDQVGSAVQIAHTSRERTAQIAAQFAAARDPERAAPMEYRSAGQYIIDVWRARLGNEEVAERVDLFNRAAAHQTTADNPGLLPERLLEPVISFLDQSRPFVSALGPRPLPSGSWSRPQITQHTQVGVQSAEKGELVSRKMTIGKLPVTAKTFGGYVNVSRQDADWTQPSIMDMIVSDLAGQYAIETENDAVDTFVAGATAGDTIPTGTPTPEAISGAIWAAAADAWTATQGQGRLIGVTGPDMLGLIGPLFPPVNPQNAQSSGFSAAAFGTGAVGSVAGVPFYVTAAMAANTMLVLSTAAAEVYEDRVGALQVTEPSVLGIQVAYAGYFAELLVQAGGVIKVVKTP